MTFPLLTYPLDIIKTNRILQTSLAKEGAESIPKEFLALYEKGGMKQGLYRGFLIGFLAASLQGPISGDAKTGALAGLALSVLTNPLNILQVHKQSFHNSQTKTYSQITSEVGVTRMFTLGLIPSIGRNFLITAGLIPTLLGNNDTLITFGYALGGIVLSHPFEVARVIIQH
jgi:hypothetical protein